jgi:uncharacterized membrane protein (GlpM family)
MWQFILRFIVGGFVVATIPTVASRVGPGVAGVISLLPVVTLLGFAFLGGSDGSVAVQRAALGAVMTVPAVLAFLLGTYAALRMGWRVSGALVAGYVAWLLVAGPIAAVMVMVRP